MLMHKTLGYKSDKGQRRGSTKAAQSGVTRDLVRSKHIYNETVEVDSMAGSNPNNWRNNNCPPQVSSTYHNPPSTPFYPEMTQSPAYRSPAVNPPHQMMFRAPVPHYNQRMYGAPAPPYNQMGFQSPAPHYNHRPMGNPPGLQGGPRGDLNYIYPPGTSRGSSFTNPHIGSSPHVNYARGGPRYNSSPNFRNTHTNSGRGQGRSRGDGMGRGYGMRYRTGEKKFSAEERPDLFYKKEFVEDPWKLEKPLVFWKRVVDPRTDNSWLPASIRSKKSKVSPEETSFRPQISQQSLAEVLAAGFNESMNEAAGSE